MYMYMYMYMYIYIYIYICRCGSRYLIVVSRTLLATKRGMLPQLWLATALSVFHAACKATVTKTLVLSPCNLLAEAVVGLRSCCF